MEGEGTSVLQRLQDSELWLEVQLSRGQNANHRILGLEVVAGEGKGRCVGELSARN